MEPTDTAAVATVYALDPTLSRFTARAFATGLLASFGHNPSFAIRRFAGEAKFAADHPAQAAVRIVVQPGSLELLDKVSEKDRREIESTMHNEIFETSRYPEIVFEASNPSISKGGPGLYWINLLGRLTLRGATQPQQITAQVLVNDAQLRANGEFTVRQTSYGIKLVSVAGGALKLKDEVKLTFDFVAHKRVPQKEGS
ncbi:MAG: YceI family protein [Bryobacterales bacterium]|nr:YceI family protein [Bryobacterales bacterium]